MFSNKIFPQSDELKKSFIHQLKNQQLPILIYGAQNIAHTIYNYLKENDLEILGFCLDPQFIPSSTKPSDIPIYSCSEIDTLFDKYILVIGFGDPIKTYHLLLQSTFKHCHQVYIYPFYDPMPSISFDFIQKNMHLFEQTYKLFQDNISKEIMLSYLNSKLGNKQGIKLLDLWKPDQYINEITLPFLNSKDIYFIDCGAYTGDTILSLHNTFGNKLKKVYSFEPDPSNFKALTNTISTHHINNVTTIQKGTWYSSCQLHFSSSDSSSSICNDGDISILVTSIDEIVKDNPITFIKMDVEGSELESLKGAQHTIQTNMPLLAICVYHKIDDLITIPQYISQFETEKIKYHFYLRHHCHTLTETVLYAVPYIK